MRHRFRPFCELHNNIRSWNFFGSATFSPVLCIFKTFAFGRSVVLSFRGILSETPSNIERGEDRRRIGYSCSDATLNFFGQNPKGKSTRMAKEKGERPASRGKARATAWRSTRPKFFLTELVGANEFRDRVALAKVFHLYREPAARSSMSLSTLASERVNIIPPTKRRKKREVIMAERRSKKKKKTRSARVVRTNYCRLDSARLGRNFASDRASEAIKSVTQRPPEQEGEGGRNSALNTLR